MSNGKSREQFENWIITSGLEADLSRGNHGCYLNPPTHWLYCAWVASRDAIEVELPISARMYFNGAPAEAYTDGIKCWHGGVDACRVAIESAGLKVKP